MTELMTYFETLVDETQKPEAEVMTLAFQAGLRQLWRERTLGRYLRGEIDREQAVEMVGIDWVELAERQHQNLENEILAPLARKSTTKTQRHKAFFLGVLVVSLFGSGLAGLGCDGGSGVGAGNVAAAIIDAGPLIHLAETGGLPLLSLFGALHIPGAVWSETVGQKRVEDGDVSELGNGQRHDLPHSQVIQFVRQNGFEHLQEGERGCLYLCRRIGVATLLTDDLAVREAAKRLDWTPVGSLGVVVRAYRLGRISLGEAERRIADLYDVSSLFVTRAIVELAIEQLQSSS